MSNLIPADRSQCQAEIPSGNAFSLGGGAKMLRCKNSPTVIATEKEPGADGLRGSMSLCDECKSVLLRQVGDVCDFEVINHDQ